MNRPLLPLLTLALLPATALPMHAHFLFLRITEPGKNKRTAEVYFSDTATAGDPTFIKKIAHTKLFIQTKPGQFQPLKVNQGKDRLRATLPTTDNFIVIGQCTYGVLARRTPFLLRHFPKAMLGTMPNLRQMKPFAKVPLEIIGHQKAGKLHLQVLKNGKPFPKAKIYTLTDNLSGEKNLQCNAQGQLTWQPPKTGWYMVYTSDFHNHTGTHEGKAYRQIRDFATLSFHWPNLAKVLPMPK